MRAFRQAVVARSHGGLGFRRAIDRVHCVGEFDQHALTGGLDDAPAILAELGIDQFLAVGLQRRQGAGFAIRPLLRKAN